MNSANTHELGDALDGIRLRTLDRLHRMRQDAEVIRRSNADAGTAMVDAKGRVRGLGLVRIQAQKSDNAARGWQERMAARFEIARVF